MYYFITNELAKMSLVYVRYLVSVSMILFVINISVKTQETISVASYCVGADTGKIIISNTPAGEQYRLMYGLIEIRPWDSAGVSGNLTWSNLIQGDYEIVRQGDGLTIDTVTISENPSPVFTVNPLSTTLTEGNAASITATLGLGYSYSWSPSTYLTNNRPDSGLVSIAPPSQITPYIYSIVATDGATSCQSSPIDVSITVTDVLTEIISSLPYCTGSDTGKIRLDNSNVKYTYGLRYNNAPVGVLKSGTGGTLEWTQLAAGTYEIYRDNVNILVGSIVVLENPSPIFTVYPYPLDTTLTEGNAASITATLGLGYSYSWSPSTYLTNNRPDSGLVSIAPPSQIAPYIYSIVATDGATSCQSSPIDVSITVTDALTEIISSLPYCTGNDTGKIRLDNSNVKYTYGLRYNNAPVGVLKSGTGGTLEWTQQAAGTYEIYRDNVNILVGSIVVLENPSPVFTVYPLDTTLIDGNAVSVNATAGLGYLYSWSPATYLTNNRPDSGLVSIAPPSQIAPYIYSIVATDGATSCQSSPTDISITVTDPLIETISSLPYCTGSDTGKIRLDNSNVKYTYGLRYNNAPVGVLKSGTGGTLEWTQRVAGTYEIYRDNANILVGSIVVLENPSPIFIVNPLDTTLIDGNAVSVNATSGLGYLYSWSPATYLTNNRPDSGLVSIAPPSQIAPYIYSIVATDGATNCQSSPIDVSITVISPTLEIISSESHCAGNDTGKIILDNSIPIYTYSLRYNNAQVGITQPGTGGTIIWSQLVTGTYDIYRENTNLAIGTVTINENPLPVFNFLSDSNFVICEGGAARVDLSSPPPGTNYLWTPTTYITNVAVDASVVDIFPPYQNTLHSYKVIAINTNTSCLSSEKTVTISVDRVQPALIQQVNQNSTNCNLIGSIAYIATPTPTLTTSGVFNISGVGINNVPGENLTDNGDGTSSLNKSLSVANQPYDLIYTFSDQIGCTSSDTISITIYDQTALPAATITGDITENIFCEGQGKMLNFSAEITRSGILQVGEEKNGYFSSKFAQAPIFKWNPISTSIVASYDISIAPEGVDTIWYGYTDVATGCTVGSRFTLRVGDTLEIINLDDTYCLNNPTVQLESNKNSNQVVFKVNSINETEFRPLITGNYTINASFPFTASDGTACTDNTFQTVTVHPLPDAGFSGLDTIYCSSDPTDILIPNLINTTGIGTWGGAFSSTPAINTALNGGVFNPNQVTIPPSQTDISLTIKYIITNSLGCTDSTSHETIVKKAPDAYFSFLDPYSIPDTLSELQLDNLCRNEIGIPLSPNQLGGIFSGNSVLGSTFFPQQVSDNSLGTELLVTYTINDPISNCTSVVTRNPIVKPLPNISFTTTDNDTTYCQSAIPQEILFTGTPIIPPGIFSIVPASDGFVNRGNGTAIISLDSIYIGTYDVTYQYQDANGCFNSITKQIEIFPLPVLDFSTDTINVGICDSMKIAPQSYNGIDTWQWVPAVYLDNNMIREPTFVPGFSTIYSLTGTDSTTGCSTTGQVFLNVAEPPIADAGNDQLLPSTVVNITLDGSNSQGDNLTYSWTKNPAAQGLISGVSLFNSSATYSPVQGSIGDHILYLSVEDKFGCTNQDSVILTVNSTPPLAKVPNDTVIGICQNIILDGNNSTGSNIVSYQWSPATYLQNPNTSTALFTPPSNLNDDSLFIFTLTITNGFGVSDSNQIKIQVINNPDVVASNDDVIGICETKTLNSTINSSVAHSLLWTTSSVNTLSNDTIFNPIFTPTFSSSIDFTITVTDKYGCVGVDETRITVEALPNANAGDDLTLGSCNKDTLDGGLSSGNNLNYQWLPVNALFTPFASSTVIDAQSGLSPNTTQSYQLIVTDQFSCKDTDEVNITVALEPIAIPSADTTIGICQSVILRSDNSTGSIAGYSWTPSTNLDDGNKPAPTFSPTNVTNYSILLEVTDIYGCKSSAGTNIFVNALPEAIIKVGGLDEDSIEIGVCNDSLFSGLFSTGEQPLSYSWLASVSLSNTDTDKDTLRFPVTTNGRYEIVLTVTDIYGCLSKDTLIVNVIEPPNVEFLNLADEYCVGSPPVLFTSNQIFASGVFSGDSVTHLNNQSAEFNPNNVGRHFVSFSYVDNFGCPNTITKDVVVNNLPNPVLSLQPNSFSSCLNDNGINIIGIPTNANGVLTSTNTDFVDNNNGTGIFNNSTVGIFSVYYTYTDPLTGCVNSDTNNITVNPLPNAFAGNDEVVCGDSISLNASNLTGIWTKLTGTSIFANNDPTNPNAKILNLQEGSNLFKWEVIENGCLYNDTIDIRNNTHNVNAGDDNLSICSQSIFTSASPVPNNSSGLWSFTQGNGSLFNAQSPTTEISGLTPDTNIIRWTITENGCESYDSIIWINNLPTPAEIKSINPSFVCLPTATVASKSIRTNEIGTWNRVLGTANVVSASDTITQIENLSLGLNVFEWQVNKYGCVSSEFDSIYYEAALIVEDTIISCDNYTIINASPPETSFSTSVWGSVEGGILATYTLNDSTLEIKLIKGKNIIRLSRNNKGCTSSDSVVILNKNLDVNAGDDLYLCGNQIGNLNATPIPPGGYGTWNNIGTSLISDYLIPDPTISNIGPGQNILIWVITDAGCIENDTVFVYYDKAEINDDSITVCTNSVELEAIPPRTIDASGTWSIEEGAGTFSSLTTATTTVTNLAQGKNVFKWNITLKGCTSTDSIIVFNNETPIDAGDTLFICENTGQLSALNPSPAIGSWSVVTGRVVLNPGEYNSPTANIIDANVGMNKLMWTVQKDQCSYLDSVYVYYDKAEIPLPVDSICGGEITLTANALTTTRSDGYWRLGTGAVTIVNSTSPITTGTNPMKGTSKLIWTVSLSNGFCSSEDTISIYNEDIYANAGGDLYLCEPTATLSPIGVELSRGTWKLLSGGVGWNTNIDSFAVISNVLKGENVLLWEVSRGICNVKDTLSVFLDYPEASVDTSICDSSITLSAAPLTSGTGLWSLAASSGIPIFDVPDNPNTKVTEIGMGNNVFVWTVTNNTCFRKDTLIINNKLVNTNMNPAFGEVCNTSYTLEAPPIPSVASGYWTLLSGGGTLLNNDTNYTIISNLGSGDNVLNWQVDNEGCLSSSDIIIRNNGLVVDAGNDQTICSSEADLDADFPPVGFTGNWEIISGTGNFFSSIDPKAHLAVGQGTNIYKWVIDYNACLSSDTVTIISNKPTTPDAGPDVDIRPLSFGTLVANSPVLSETGKWKIVNGAGTLLDSSLANTQVSNLARGVNQLSWTIFNGDCSSSDLIEILAGDPIEANAGTDRAICSDEVVLEAKEPPSGTLGTWTIVSGAASFNNNSLYNTKVYNLAYGPNVFEWKINIGVGNVVTDTVIIINNLPSQANIGTDRTICQDTFNLFAAPITRGTGLWTTMAGGGDFRGQEILTNPIVYNLQRGLNRFVWETTLMGCKTSDTITINNSTPSEALIVNPDTMIICDNQITLDPNVPQFGTGQWKAILGSAEFDKNTVFDIRQGVNIFLWEISTDLCSVADTIVVINSLPSTPNGALDTINVCYDSLSLSGNPITTGAGTWSTSNSNSVITDIYAPNSTVTNLSLGNNILTWTAVNIDTVGTFVKKCTLFDELNVRYNHINASVGADFTVCEASTDLLANSPYPGNGNWYIAGGLGTATFESPSSYSTVVNNLSRGQNYLIWEINNINCIDRDTIIITNNAPTQAGAGIDLEICQDSTVLRANTPGGEETGGWTVISGSGSFIDDTLYNTTVNNLGKTADNILRWTIVKGVNNEACYSFDDVAIINNTVIADAGYDNTVCENNTNLQAELVSGTGAWSILSGSGQAEFVDPNNPLTLATKLDRGDNVLLWSLEKGICTDRDTVIITNDEPSVANAGPDVSICTDSSELIANIPIVGTGQWKILSGSADIDNINNARTDIKSLAYGANTLEWEITYNNCISKDQIIMKNDKPSDAYAGEDIDMLCVDSIILNARRPEIGTGQWSVISSTAKYDDITNNTTIARNLLFGQNLLLWTVTNSTCSLSDIIRINSYAPAPAIVEADKDICDDNISISAIAIPNGSNSTGLWTVVSGQADFDNPNLNATNATNIGFGQNIFRWTVSTPQGCSVFDELTIANNSTPTANAGADQTLCATTTQLFANPAGVDEGRWNVIKGSAEFENPTANDTRISKIGFGHSILEWSISNENCTSKDVVEIINNQIEADAGVDRTVIENFTTLVANYLNSNIGRWHSIDPNVIIDNANNNETGVSNLIEGLNSFIWTIDNNNCITQDTLQIYYSLIPLLDFTPSVSEGCAALPIQFSNTSQYTSNFIWNFGDGNTSTERNPIHIFEEGGLYRVKLGTYNKDSIFTQIDKEINVFEKADINFSVNPTTAYTNKDKVRFLNLTTNSTNLLWDFGDEVTSTEENPLHIYSEPNIYDVKLVAETEYGCKDSLLIEQAIEVKNEGYAIFPNSFTPNLESGNQGVYSPHDVSNDVFHPVVKNIIEYQLDIYNRWGQLVFSTNDVNIGWDGYYGGKLVQEGIYVWTVKGKFESGTRFKDSGDVLLIYNQ